MRRRKLFRGGKDHMKLDIEVRHFSVFNLLILLIVWANTCYVLFFFFRFFFPILVNTLLLISGAVLTVAMVLVTIYVTAKWIRHHNLGWWVIIGLIILFILSYALESTVRGIFYRQQVFDQQELR